MIMLQCVSNNLFDVYFLFLSHILIGLLFEGISDVVYCYRKYNQ